MLSASAAPGSPNTSKAYLFFYAVQSALILLNKSIVTLYPYPNVVLLLQLSSSAALARISIGSGVQVAFAEHGSAAVPLAGFSLVALASMHAMNQGANVDHLVVFSACTPVAVAVADWLFMSRKNQYWLDYALVLLLSTWAGSLLFASLTGLGLVCLFVYFLCATFHLCYVPHYFRTVKQTTMERVYVQNLLGCLPCLVITLMFHDSNLNYPTHITHWSGFMLAFSCIMSFLVSYYSWEVQTNANTASGCAATTSCSKLISLALNYVVWDQHGSAWANWLLAGAIIALQVSLKTKHRLKPKYQRSSSKGPEVHRNPATYAVGILAVAAAIAGVLWVGGTLGTAVTRNHLAMLVNSRHQLEHDLDILGRELVTLRGKAAVWEANMAGTYTKVAVGASGSFTGRNSSSSINSSDKQITSASTSVQDSSGSRSSGSRSSGSSSNKVELNINQTGGSSSSSSGAPTNTSSSGKRAAGVGQVSDPGYLQRLKEAASKPINVVVMTGLFWQLDPSMTANCSVDGIPLECHFTQKQDRVETADALYYHVPSFNGVPRAKAFPDQLRVAMSLESAVYYSNLDNPGYMCGFDAEMSYRHCAQVVNWYSLETFKNLFAREPLPFEQKHHALVYINSNCGAASGRSTILRQLMKLNGSVPVHSLGNCDRNMPWPLGNPKKTEVQRRYKFCVTMENSVSPDYVTEKVWDGLTAGCVPVYLGAPSALDMIPDRTSIITYDPLGNGNASTPEELDQLMHVIGSYKESYEAMLQWKHREPEDQPSPLFRYLWSVQHTSGECFLCQFLVRHRANPQPRYTTCMFNSTWMEANGRSVFPAYGLDGHCPPM